MRSIMLAAVLLAASASDTALVQAWTGLTYSLNRWPEGSVEADLHDAKSYLRNGLTSTSVDMFKRVIARDPKRAEAYFWLSGAYRKLGEGAAARTALDKALQLSIRRCAGIWANWIGSAQRYRLASDPTPPERAERPSATISTRLVRCRPIAAL